MDKIEANQTLLLGFDRSEVLYGIYSKLIKTKIIIAGIGGVGGYYGGLLARKYFNHDSIEINFIARDKNLKQIQESFHGEGLAEWLHQLRKTACCSVFFPCRH